jgi:hypothetical protein
MASTLTFLPRGIELQREAIQELEALESAMQVLLDQMSSSNRNDEANQALSMKLLSRGVRHELLMWVSLKEEKWDEAWSNLVEAQESVEDAVRASPISLALNAINYAKKLQTLEMVVFPPQTFNSLGYTATSLVCSICGGNYDECQHIEGRAYLGKLCTFSSAIVGIKEISIVDKPENKRSRIIQFDEGRGVRDKMTWRISEKKTEP